MDGNYTLKVSGEQPVLVFSYIGYKTLEIPGNKPTLNVTMSDDTQVIDEVVVTALGIKREKKMLGYAVQEIKKRPAEQDRRSFCDKRFARKSGRSSDEYGRYRFGRFHQDYDSW